jgi:phage shock protein A
MSLKEEVVEYNKIVSQGVAALDKDLSKVEDSVRAFDAQIRQLKVELTALQDRAEALEARSQSEQSNLTLWISVGAAIVAVAALAIALT